MMRKSKLIVSLSAALLLATAPFAATALEADAKTVDKMVPVQFLGMNDLHGYIDGNNKKDPIGAPIGGMASLAYHFEQEKAAFAKANKLKSTKTNSLAIQEGDLVGGSPAISGLLQDEPVMNIVNAMNFSVGALGNHEFDEGISEFQRLLKGGAPIKNVTQNYELVKDYNYSATKMDVLSANINDKKTNKLLKGFKPYVIKNIDGVKVAFIGVVTPSIKDVVLAEHTKDIEIVDPGKAVAKYTKELRKKGVNAITVVAHASVAPNKEANSSITTQQEDDLSGEVIDMLKTVNKVDPKNSIDVVFGGHNHAYANDTYKKVRIVQAHNYGEAYSVVNGKLSKKTKDFVATPTATIKYNYTQPEAIINSNKVSKKVNGIVTEAKTIVGKVMDQPIATMDVESLSKIAPTKVHPTDQYPIGGSEVGNLVTDAQLAYARTIDAGVDFAFTNSGGVRSNLNGTANGDSFTITRGAAQAVQPFGNTLNIIELTGAQVKAAINDQFIGGYGLEMAGLNYTFNEKGVVDVFVNGQKIDESRTYKAVLNDFLLGGGDKFPTFIGTKVTQYLGVDTDIFINYIEKTATLKKEDVATLRLERVQ
ncbi:5'-nucleotidase [Kurthia huakuii]|uniref:bifunctional metallophosphatase/5'-nucleotidase n=2 Tax=Kurthia huakuii TaxID=1421019 RepID=UPI001F24FF10|nr:bifunctional metallophosphatase/5'-nucleotidase [Kurthia huakuii]MBM7698790.1 5'-nucleotidase [Kurthia huakuii]